MDFYLAAADDMLQRPSDNPTIGLILCKGKRELVVEYALRNLATPMGLRSSGTWRRYRRS